MNAAIAIIHDWLNQVGGAEAVLRVLKEMFPAAPIYTSIYWREAMPAEYRAWDIHTSFMDRLPLVKQHHQPFLLLYPLAFRSFDLRGCDLILSNKSAFAHCVTKLRGATHICYCLTPTRFVWNYDTYVEQENIPTWARAVLPFTLGWLRRWDRAAADCVDHFVAISNAVRERIAKFYGRDSTVIHPPIRCDEYTLTDQPDDYFLILSRLVPYKRIDLAIEAFNRLGLPLVVAGDGRDRLRLETMAGPSVCLLGRVSDDERRRLLAHCRALIFPGEEDFGIASLEAQASGRPVIAYAAGGALDTVIDGTTGILFREQTADALAEAVRGFDDRKFDPHVLRQNAACFDVAIFKDKLRQFIDESMGQQVNKSTG
jgi:glycosyltransferase involved in cell wall biosynthesis